MSYTPVNWKDYPDKTTPTSAANLNKMEQGIINNDTAITELTKTVEENTEDISALKDTLTNINTNLGDQVTYSLDGTTLTITTK